MMLHGLTLDIFTGTQFITITPVSPFGSRHLCGRRWLELVANDNDVMYAGILNTHTYN